MVFVLVLAGCGDAPEPDAQAIAEDASAAAEERATLRLEMDALGAQPMRCDGAVDYGRHRVRMTCAGDGDLELITIGRDQYSRGGWVVGSGEDEEPTNRRQKISGAHDEPTDAFPDLREVLRDLRRAAISSERLGREQVRGVDTTRVRVVVDPTKTSSPGERKRGRRRRSTCGSTTTTCSGGYAGGRRRVRSMLSSSRSASRSTSSRPRRRGEGGALDRRRLRGRRDRAVPPGAGRRGAAAERLHCRAGPERLPRRGGRGHRAFEPDRRIGRGARTRDRQVLAPSRARRDERDSIRAEQPGFVVLELANLSCTFYGTDSEDPRQTRLADLRKAFAALRRSLP